MSRTPMNENIIRQENADQAAQAKTAYADEQKSLSEFSANEGTLARGGQVGVNPYQTPDYLANTNRAIADATSGENSAAKQQLIMGQRRSGGQGGTATNADITRLALGKIRTGASLQNEQKMQDFNKNLSWQQYLAGAPLQVAGHEGQIYGTATQGESSTASDMEKFAELQQKAWYEQLNQMIQAGKSLATVGVSAATGGAGVGGFGEGG